MKKLPAGFWLVASAVLCLAAATNALAETANGASDPTGSQNTLPAIAKGATWKYWDARETPGETWAARDFDDAAWKSGPGQLGYGDADEGTVICQGVESAQRPITVYFRKSFQVADAAAVTNLILQILRDDGVIVYLNGVEVFRNNLPQGAVTPQTLASSSINHEAEDAYITARIEAPQLVAGANVLAVEIHQVVQGSADCSFDLAMTVNHPAANRPPTVALTSPANGDNILAPGPIMFEAAASDPDGAIAKVQFVVNGTVRETVTAPPYAWVWRNVEAGEYAVEARATDTAGATANSALATIHVNNYVVTGTLIPAGSVWKYLDNGSDQGQAWIQTGFDDSAWQSGPGPLGYNNSNEATVVSFGPDSTKKHITTYFRKTFTVEDPTTISNLLLRVMRDDGAATYLNGVQVSRGNLAAGATYQTTARKNYGAPAETRYYAANVNPQLLRAGENVLAAEVHQYSATSDDLSFDLELIARDGVPNLPPLVTLTSPAAGSSFTAPATVTLAADVTLGSSPVMWVEFYVGNQLVGRDETAPYSVTWQAGEAGSYSLKAVATDSRRNPAASASVTVEITRPANLPPVISLIKPQTGAGFVAPATVEIVAAAADADGTVAGVEVFAGDVKLGDAAHSGINGGGTTAGWRLVWENVPVGEYHLTARATDNAGAQTVSAPVGIVVAAVSSKPVVTVTSTNRTAVEGLDLPAIFQIVRVGGDQSQPLTVRYAMSGTAENGVDYEAVSGTAVIPAGEAMATVVIRALADQIDEPVEKVELTLQQSLDYQIGEGGSSIAAIVPAPPLPPGALAGPSALAAASGPAALIGWSPMLFDLQVLPSGAYRMMIAGEVGKTVIVEASDNLQDWTPIATLVNKDGLIEFTDPSAANFNRSFYRVITE